MDTVCLIRLVPVKLRILNRQEKRGNLDTEITEDTEGDREGVSRQDAKARREDREFLPQIRGSIGLRRGCRMRGLAPPGRLRGSSPLRAFASWRETPGSYGLRGPRHPLLLMLTRLGLKSIIDNF